MTKQASTPTNKLFPGAFELFPPSITAIGKNAGSFIGLIGVSLGVVFATVIISLIAVIMALAAGGTDRPVFAIALVTAITATVIAACLAMTPFFTLLQLRSSQGVQMGLGEVFRKTRPYFWRLLGLRALTGLVYVGGLLFFIAPFFFLWQRYMLSRYYIVDKDMQVLAAMKASSTDSQAYASTIWGLVGVRTLWWVAIQIFGIAGSIVDFLYSCAPPLRYLQIQEVKSAAKNK